MEPGRYVAAECSVLLGSVYAAKNNGDRRYVGTNLGFNVLVRPAMAHLLFLSTQRTNTFFLNSD